MSAGATGPLARKAALSALFAGVLFGAGLSISGMTRPAKVLSFLDLAGAWDPSLAFVMGAAVAVFFAAHRYGLRRQRPFFGASFPAPPARSIDVRLVVGAALFGVGWGLGGFCPGPAIVALSGGVGPALVFVPAMALGIIAGSRIVRRRIPAGAEAMPPSSASSRPETATLSIRQPS